MLILSLAACGKVCGPGTEAADGICVPSPYQTVEPWPVWETAPDAVVVGTQIPHDVVTIAEPLDGRVGPEPLTSWSLGVGRWTLTRDLVSSGDRWAPWDGRLRVTDGEDTTTRGLGTARPGQVAPMGAPVRAGDSWYVVVEADADLDGKFPYANAVLVRLPDRGAPELTDFPAASAAGLVASQLQPVVSEEGLVGWLQLSDSLDEVHLSGCSTELFDPAEAPVTVASICATEAAELCDPVASFVGVHPLDVETHVSRPLTDQLLDVAWQSDCAG